ncbi:hypothetical protein ACA910_012923 [Epithemia clementina (nom. ined.)]
MPYRKFHPRQYQSLPDIMDEDDEAEESDDRDEITSFSSMKLAKDQDKPTKWKKRVGDATRMKRRLPFELGPASNSAPPPPPVNSQGSSFSSVLEHSRSEPKPGLPGLTDVLSYRAMDFTEQREPPTSVDTSFLSRRKDAKKKTDLLGCLPSPFDGQPPSNNNTAHDKVVGRVPDTLPSPKENRHPQTKLFSMCSAPAAPSSGSGDDEGTTDARAALAPSSALNLIQCWRNSAPSITNNSDLVDAQSIHVKNGNNKDPLLVALQVVRLKRELKKLRVDADSRRTVQSRSSSDLVEGPQRHGVRKKVHFAEQLVTEVRERPFTEPEEMDKLYFVNGELEELEWDRSTVELDQFECIMQEENSANQGPYIEVEHNSRKLHSIGDEGLPHSLSDLSFY